MGYKGHLNHSNVKQWKDLLHPLLLVSCARSKACDGIVVCTCMSGITQCMCVLLIFAHYYVELMEEKVLPQDSPDVQI